MKKIFDILSFPLIFFVLVILSIVSIEICSFKYILVLIVISLVYFGIGLYFCLTKRWIPLVVTAIFLISNLLVITNLNSIYKNYFITLKEIRNSEKVVGYISDFAQNKKDRVDFVFTIYGIKNQNITDYKRVKPFKVIVKLKGSSDIKLYRGDVLAISKKAYIPQLKINNFGYKKFLFYKNIYGIVNAKESDIKKLDKSIGVSHIEKFFAKTIWSFRDSLLTKLDNNLNERSYSFILSIFFGIRSELDSDVLLDFQNTGMLHLLAISGMHISFIAGVFFVFLNFFLSKSKAYFISLIILFCYITLILVSPSSNRAFLMYLVQSLFFVFGMRTIGFTVLSISGIFLTINNPFAIFDIGFQLSFFATAGILLFGKIIEEEIKIDIPNKVKSLFSMTLSTFITLFLLQWAIFKKIQLFALLSSIIIIPFFEYLFITLFFGIIVYYFLNFNFITVIIDFLIDIFLKSIRILHAIKPVTLPEIPLFIPYVAFPVIVIFAFVILPEINKFLRLKGLPYCKNLFENILTTIKSVKILKFVPRK